MVSGQGREVPLGVLSRAVYSRHGLVEVRQVLLSGMEKEDGGTLGTQRCIPGGAAGLREIIEAHQDQAGGSGGIQLWQTAIPGAG